MPSMYAKLMGRITESSLMEEDIPTRYAFMMLLAMADPKGYVIGTDVAIARRMNMPLADFQEAKRRLLAPDPDSNSQEEDGRRIIESDGERGYFVVNYQKYRDTRDEEQRRDYMRTYMQNRRKLQRVNSGKPGLAQEEGEANAEGKGEPPTLPKPPAPPRGRGGISEGSSSANLPTTEQSKRIATLFHRKLTTPWTGKEKRAYLAIGTVPEEDLAALEAYYGAHWPPNRDLNILRHDLLTFLNNFPGEVDRARNFKTHPDASKKTPAAQRTADDRDSARTGFRPAPIPTKLL